MTKPDYELLEKQFNRLSALYYQCQKERDDLRKSASVNSWVKPTSLPDDFWAECFVSVYDEDGIGIFTEINCVKKVNNNAVWYSDTEREWFSFREDIQVRVQKLRN